MTTLVLLMLLALCGGCLVITACGLLLSFIFTAYLLCSLLWEAIFQPCDPAQ